MGTHKARSWFVVPGDRPERFDEPVADGAHAIILDLEDLVGPAKKDAARRAVARWLTENHAYVRINAVDTEWYEDDLAAVASVPGLQGVVLPKADGPAPIERTASALPAAVPVLPLIETAAGLQNAPAVAATPGVAALIFGSLDFGLDLGIDVRAGQDDVNLLYARSRLVIASRAAGIAPPIDGVTTDLDDPGVAAADAGRARHLGFGGKLCIEPRQIDAVNGAFAPSEGDLDWARRVLAAIDGADGEVMVRLDGQLIDRPVISRAQQLLRTAR
ncbi:HpcH/HpaI aldolase/citrate lyase family protein [Pseudonocardia xinjiangensis]|uniref:HpcH/HpaI aldolase/citrate lyase family protein n=1 Tax=Pseudonocardia xinjiangensis TaxID=75289 RepID=UPI003D8C289A